MAIRELDGALILAAEAMDELIQRHHAQSALTVLESEKASREKYISLFGHDLRTPLASARANAQLIQRRPDHPEDCKRHAARIVHAIDRAEKMIVDLLDGNRLLAGFQLPIHRESCELLTILREISDDLAFMHEGRCVLEGSAVSGSFDPRALRRAVENLLINAVKYGAEDRPIRISIASESNSVKISVHNEGEPISEKKRAGLFQWYASSSNVPNGQGSWGLGLMLVKGIADAHGGSVSVRSSSEEGTEFTLCLPLTP